MDYRYRVLVDQEEPATIDHSVSYPDSQSETALYPETFSAKRSYTAMTDVVTPHWRKIIAQGGIINNPLWYDSLTVSQEPAWVRFGQRAVSDGYIRLITNAIIEPLPVTLSASDLSFADDMLADFANKRSQAITSAWAEVSECDLLTWATVKEMPSTVRWLHSLYTRVVDVLHLYKRKRLRLEKLRRRVSKKAAKKYANALANLWMELRYAIRPMVFDAVGVYNAAFGEHNKPFRFTARGFEQQLGSADYTQAKEWNSWSLNFAGTERYHYQVRAGVLAQVEDFHNVTIQAWGLDKPLEAIYDTLPLSFVLDWVFNIGDTLASWTHDPGISPLASWTVERHRLVRTYSLSEASRALNAGYDEITTPSTIDDFGKYMIQRDRKVRSTNPNRPILPSLRVNFNMAKTLDLAIIGKNIARSFVK